VPSPTRSHAPIPRRAPLLAAVACIMSALAATPALATFPGDNGRIAFLSDRDGDEDIWTVGPDGSEPVNLTADSPRVDAVPNYSADGQRIAFMSNRITAQNPSGDFELFVMGADGSDLKQLTANRLDDEEPTWSPDGRWLAFSRDFDPVQGKTDMDVFKVRLDGTGERNLTRSRGVDDLQPEWSPSGRRIAFASERAGRKNLDIYTMRPDGTRWRRLTHSPKGGHEHPSYSPDGRQIAFNTNRDKKFEIYKMRWDGRREIRLTVTTGNYGNALPDWSPDGTRIVFNSTRNGDVPDVFTMLPDGTDVVNLTNDPAFDYTPDWQAVDGTAG
jgi:Tol biopolymer transport system component